jgi:hypothetical protein
LSLSLEILSSTYSGLLEWPSTIFFIWFKWFFFWGFLYLCSTSLSYLVLSSLLHISFFIMSFVCWSPLWIHLDVSVSFQVVLFVMSWYCLNSSYMWCLNISCNCSVSISMSSSMISSFRGDIYHRSVGVKNSGFMFFISH